MEPATYFELALSLLLAGAIHYHRIAIKELRDLRSVFELKILEMSKAVKDDHDMMQHKLDSLDTNAKQEAHAKVIREEVAKVLKAHGLTNGHDKKS